MEKTLSSRLAITNKKKKKKTPSTRLTAATYKHGNKDYQDRCDALATLALLPNVLLPL
jgi:hypothetical protein